LLMIPVNPEHLLEVQLISNLNEAEFVHL